MKNIILSIILSFGVSAAQAAKLVHSNAWTDSKTQKIEVSMGSGFGETGFGGPSAVCFIGPIKGVCQAVEKEAADSLAQYRQGDHGMFKVNSCQVIGREFAGEEFDHVVEVKYTRINDYDEDLDLTLNITNCN